MEGKGKKSFLGVLIFSVIVGKSLLFATDFPSMPSIDSPSMPSMSGSSYQPSTPWRGSAPYVPSQQVDTTDSNTSGTNSADNAEEIAETVAGVALTAQSISGLGGLDALDSLGGLEGLTGISGLDGLNGLEALQGIDSLSNLKDEDDLRDYLLELTGSKTDSSDKENSSKTSENSATATVSSNQTSSADNATLQQILKQLEILAAQQKAQEATASKTVAPQKTETPVTSRILRFRANATDLLPSCKTVYFSQPDPAGMFMLTGDRVINAGGKERNETFYFLFNPTLDESGKFIYQVEAQLVQDWTSERSELYPLSSPLPLTATRTGNLVTLRHSLDNWNLDLLLDLGELQGN